MNDEQATAPATGLALPVLTKGGKAFLRQVPALEHDTVPMPEWGCTVIVRELTAEEKQQYESSIVSFDRKGRPVVSQKDVGLRLILLAVVDEADNPVFTTEDLPYLRQQPGKATDRIFKRAKELSGIGDDDIERLKNA